ncbi:MAG: hypothetical protein HFE94_08045 [Acutalibacter sp.]|nr:hypothetical protein [Acutalibacter sp.]
MNRRLSRYRKQENLAAPEYTLNQEKRKRKKIPKWVRNLFAGVIIAGVVLYAPPLIMRPVSTEPVVVLEMDTVAIRAANEYLKDHPDDDFDGDGLANAKEQQAGSDPYRVDTDGDGIMDSSELSLTNTSPIIYNNTLLEITKQQMEAADKSVRSPFKINNVVLWPDNLESRAHGAVVKTLAGYRFCNFQGWVQFPEGSYVYAVEDGIHKELRRSPEGAVYIPKAETGIAVEAYERPLEMIYQFSCCGRPLYISNAVCGEILRFLLPEKGPALFTCRKMATADLDPDTSRGKEISVHTTSTQMDDSRFGRNHILLTDLAQVRRSIEENRPVISSLFSPTRGEAIVLIYGYTSQGDLLAADPETGEGLGKIHIEERASRLYDKEGKILQYEWFLFDGLGFSSYSKDRISFLMESPSVNP